jgi:membrane protein required for colicin V production
MQLGWVDVAMAAVLLVSMLVGGWRGLVFELLALAGWVAAFILAQLYAPDAAKLLPVGAPGSALNLGAAFALVFLGALVLWTIAARLVRLVLHATPLSGLDRLLGAAFGLVRGVVLLLVVALLVGLTPMARHPDWRASVGAAWLQALLRGAAPMLPAPWARHVPA